MTDSLPRIEFPKTPLPAEWRTVVEQLVERAQVIEEWANEIKQRAVLAMSMNETAVLQLYELLRDGRVKEATDAACEAAKVIHKRRSRLN